MPANILPDVETDFKKHDKVYFLLQKINSALCFWHSANVFQMLNAKEISNKRFRYTVLYRLFKVL